MVVLKEASIRFSDDILDKLEHSDAMETLEERARDVFSSQDNGSVLVRILDKLAAKGVLPPSEVSLVLAIWLGTSHFASLIASLAAPGLDDMLSSLIQSRQTGIQLILDDPEQNKCMTIEDFQETYI
ncbi:hypothetical protein FRC09_015588, partial [Ceratobasidium sp. 395]